MVKHSILLIATCLAGCTTFHAYPLPISAAEARSTLGPVAAAANELGFQCWRWDDSVGVQVDALTRLSYTLDAANGYVVRVELDNRRPKGGVKAAFAAGKRTSDVIWQRAMALRPATPVTVPSREPEEAPAPEPIEGEQTIVHH